MFEDDSYEGDPLAAAILDADWMSRQLQTQRIAALVKKQLQAAEPADLAKAEILRSQVSALSDKPDPALIASLTARFPSLPDDGGRIINAVRNGAIAATSTFLSRLRTFQTNFQDPERRVSLQQWWTDTYGPCGFLVHTACIQLTAP